MNFKYVDDLTKVEAVPVLAGTTEPTRERERRIIHAEALEGHLDNIIDEAGKMGMVVHPNKTHLLCVAATAGYDVSAFIKIEGRNHDSKEELKILGYILGTSPGVAAHVKKIKKSFVALSWILRNFKRARVDPRISTKVYCLVVRSSIEYASVVYGCLITAEQSSELERLQARSLGIIWGWDKSYRELLEMTGMETLEMRRRKSLESFTLKAIRNPRFREKWFPLRPAVEHAILNRRPYLEIVPKHERLLRAPTHTMRHLLNDLFQTGRFEVKDPRLDG